MKNNEKLNVLVNKLNEAQEVAGLELGDWDRRTKAGMEVRKAQAKQEVIELTYQFTQSLGQSIAKVFVTGTPEKIAAFSAELGKEVTVFTVGSIYEEIARLVEPALSHGGSFSSPAYLRMVEVVGMYVQTLRVFPHTNIVEPVGFGIPDFATLVAIIKETVRAAFGDTLNRAYIARSVVKQGVAEKFNKEFGVVLLGGFSPDETQSLTDTLFPGQPSFALEIGAEEEVTKSMALKTFRKIAQRLMKNTDGSTTEKE